MADRGMMAPRWRITSDASRWPWAAAAAGGRPAQPGGQIAGVEAVAGGRGVDRLDLARHGHGRHRPALGHEAGLVPELDRDLGHARRLQPRDGGLRRAVAEQCRLVVEGRQGDVGLRAASP